jgi:hypothetical protein
MGGAWKTARKIKLTCPAVSTISQSYSTPLYVTVFWLVASMVG